MATAHKFLFERSFDDAKANVDDHDDRHIKRHTTSELNAACAAARDEGYKAGYAAALAALEAQAIHALETAAAELTALNAHSTEAAEHMIATGLELALSVTRKALPELVRRHGVPELEAFVSDCLSQLVEEPRVVIRVHETELDSLDQRTEALKRMAGFDGKIVLLADPGIGAGDCKVEWADGGAERNFDQLRADLDAAISRAFGRAIDHAEPTAESSGERHV